MILFVGNSYTFVNELDVATADVFEAAGSPHETSRIAVAGYRFVDHVRDAEVDGSPWQAALAGDATWVVLQEQSQIPGFPRDHAEWTSSVAAAGALDAYPRARGDQTLLFMTWGRRLGDETNPDLFPDYPTMQAALEEGYLLYRDALSTEDRPVFVAPVGLAFRKIYEGSADPADPASLFWRLYADDGSHPSERGTYLAACVFYATITGESPEGLPSAVPDAAELQRAAAEVVLEDTAEILYPWEAGIVDDPSDDPPAGDTDPPDPGPQDQAGCGCASTGTGRWAAALVAALALIGVRRR